MDYLVRITMTKHMETITVSMTTPYLQLLYEELVNCSHKHLVLHSTLVQDNYQKLLWTSSLQVF